LQRVANTTLAMPSAPPSFGFTHTNAFPGLIFTNPVCVASPPGETNRLFVVGKNGVITVITNLAAPTETTFVDLTSRVTSTTANSGTSGEQGLLGLAFSPGYVTNHYFYVFYTGNATTLQTGRHDILSRFQILSSNTNQADATSETYIFAQYDRDPNHNSGDLHFGPDGYLYVTVGDEGAEHDGRTNAQRIDLNLFSGVLRIDVDKKPGNLTPNASPTGATTANYLVPADNPFVGASSFDNLPVNPSQVRTEFWAVGLRNPWRFNFDPLTGTLYCADVGQDQYEEIDTIRKGGNYGWAIWEGTNTPASGVSTTGRTVPVNPIPPFITYAHASLGGPGNCVIGGPVYRGAKLPQLYGQYLFADYVSGRFWSVPASSTNGTSLPPTPMFTDSSLDPTCFGVDPSNGDVLFTATKTTGYATNSTIERIIYNSTTNGAPLPPTLADTGAFTNLASLTSPNDPLQPAPGIVPYDINQSFWSDNALKSRWFSVPSLSQTIGFDPSNNWTFPAGTVWIKHFNLQLTNGDPTSIIRLETRLLVKNSNGIYGVTYRWGGSKTNATLVDANGMDESFTMDDGGGNVRTQVWHYPSQAECQTCHTSAGGFGLGFRTEQLNCTFAYPNGTTNEIGALSDAGYFSSPVTNAFNSLLALPNLTNQLVAVETRARAFLSANCSQCHQPGGTAQAANWDARFTTPTALAGLIYGQLVNNLGDPNNYVIKPAVSGNSVLLSRISTRGVGSIQMPPLDSNLIDSNAVSVVTQWIQGMTDTFWLGATPQFVTAVPGGNGAACVVSNLVTADFSSTVTLSVSGLPSGASAQFSPATITGTGSSTLTLTASGATAPGSYILTITGIGGNVTNSTTATLVVSINTPAAAGTLLWTDGSGSNTNWSTGLNWTNLTAGGVGYPGLSNDVVFRDAAAAGSAGTVDNIVDYSAAINSLWYGNTNGYHTTLIAPGQTLTVYGAVPGISGTDILQAGNEQTNVVNNPQMLYSAITGTGATLILTNTAARIQVRQGGSSSSGTVVTNLSTLDLSGLDNLIAYLDGISLGTESGVPRHTAGVLYLARTNMLMLNHSLSGVSAWLTGGNPAITLGHNTQSGETAGSGMYLGISNAIYANYVVVGRGTQSNAVCFLSFNPAVLGSHPTAYFRAADTTSKVGIWLIADNSAGDGGWEPSPAIADFTGGTVDLAVTNLYVGRGRDGNALGSTGVGTLTFDSGIINAMIARAGTQVDDVTNATNSSGVGTINVNGAGATLIASASLELAHTNGVSIASANSATSGTLNIRGGTVLANQIISGGGAAALTMSGGSLVLTNTAGTPSRPLGTIAITNATVHLRVNAGSVSTNIVTTNLIASGVNTIVIDAAANLSGTNTLPLITYASLTGTVPGNFALGTIPAGYHGTLIDDSAHKTIAVQIAPKLAPHITSASVQNGAGGPSLTVAGTNGNANGTYYVLASTNIALPLSNWTVLSTNSFDSNGNFAATNSMGTGAVHQFYILRTP